MRTIENSQCRIDGAGSSASASGPTLKLTVDITLKDAFAGGQNIYLAAQDRERNNSDWRNLGSWQPRPFRYTPPLLRILAGAIRGAEVAAHRPEEIPWADLQSPCIVAMHWHRTPELCDLLRRADFQVMVTVRHPLDVLISILHFCQNEPATSRWLEGEGGDESPLFGADPTGPEFLQYALSERARSLLGISAEWYASARAVIRYEQLVADPEGTLERTLPLLGCDARAPLSEVVRSNTLARLRPLSRHHFWRGEPGLWRRLIPPDYARQIYHRHKDLFELWGYDRPEEAPLSAPEARENWRQICEPDQAAPGAGNPAS